MKRVIIVGSPRSNGRCAHVAEMLFEANIDERPEDELFLVPVSEVEVNPCIGCNGCRKLTEVSFLIEQPPAKGKGAKPGNAKAKNAKAPAPVESNELRPRCVFDDDMQTLYDLLDEADEAIVVAPVYFSGAPAPLKCVLDRMQPYFWANEYKGPKAEPATTSEDVKPWQPRMKRPATLHVIGEGLDPHGYDALVSEVRSSLACAGFRLERILDWVGKVDESGEITEEAKETVLVASGGKPGEAPEKPGEKGRAGGKPHENGPVGGKPRAKLDLSAGQRKKKASNRGK